jgi:D-alanine-D-alanine ligase
MSDLPPSDQVSDETTEQATRPRVVVLFGGRSSEHAISCVTAGSVLAAIDREAYDVLPVGITADGRWVLEVDDSAHFALGEDGGLPEVDPTRPAVAVNGDGDRPTLEIHAPGTPPRSLGVIDVVMPLLHGPWGEDGTIQGFLETYDLRYVGAGVLASAVGMDKHYMKVVLEAAGLPVLPYVVLSERRWRSDREGCRAAVERLGFPVFVKPCRGGSSIGISKVHDPAGLDDAVEEARRWDPKVVVEAGAGAGAREIECGVLESADSPEASVVAEITVSGGHDFYDFAAKYLPGEHTRIDLPADLDDATAKQVQRLALEAFEALSCEGLARVDFFVLADGRVVVNEVNTMPGFTPTSMFPQVWAASGVDYPALVDRLLQLALRRPTGLR